MSQNATAKTTESQLPELIAERDRYQRWLDALDEKRKEVPDHIYERIVADYTVRLESAVEQLREHVDTIEERLDEKRSALDDTRATLAAKQDELVESEIRHRVGEFDSRRWQSVQNSLKTAIKEAEALRDTLTADVKRLEETASQVREPSATETAGDAAEDAVFLQALAEATGRSTEKGSNGKAASGNGNGNGNGSSSGGSDAVTRIAAGLELDQMVGRARRPTGLRTRRCDTCGTFNLPEAMFCEACGGDLPAT